MDGEPKRNSEETGDFFKAASGTDRAFFPLCSLGQGSHGHGPDSKRRENRCHLLLGVSVAPIGNFFSAVSPLAWGDGALAVASVDLCAPLGEMVPLLQTRTSQNLKL